MARAFRAQGKAFAKRLKAAWSSYPLKESAAKWAGWEDPFDRAELDTQDLFITHLDTAIGQAFVAGGMQVVSEAGIKLAWDLKNPRAVAWLAENPAAAKVAGINATTRDVLRGMVDRAVDEGWSPNKLALAIQDRYETFAVGRPQEHIQSRAHLIAVQEVGEAYCAGTREAATEVQGQGIPLEKSWCSVGDAKVSDLCASNSAQGWIPLDQAFQSGHDRPLGHVACRCDLLTRMALGDVRKGMR